MRVFRTYIFVTIVIALIAQSISLSLNAGVKPHVYNKLGSKIDHKGRKSYDIFSTIRPPVNRSRVFFALWRHGFKSAVDPFREQPPKSRIPMTRSAWVSSRFYRAGLDFQSWSKRRASWEARRYDRYSTLAYLSRAHPIYAIIGYWSGRLVFFTIVLVQLLLLAIIATVEKVIIPKKRNLVRKRGLS